MFTLLPIRIVLALWFSVSRSLRRILSEKSFPSQSVLQPAEMCDLLRGLIVLISGIAMQYVDIPVLYHILKSQSVIKLYIFFNMLEVSDKLFSCFGQDILDTLFWTATESGTRKRDRLGVIPHLLLASLYVFIHTVLVLLQATTLNVAINSKNKALLTIMMSNNFVELKSMVFKKFEKTNLFHMSCSDVRERFHYLILLVVVIVQTLKEYNWSGNQIFSLLTDSFWILTAEVVVDWLKHCFVTRFNEISPDVYMDYNISLAYDLTSSKLKSVSSPFVVSNHVLSPISGLFRSLWYRRTPNGIHSSSLMCPGLQSCVRLLSIAHKFQWLSLFAARILVVSISHIHCVLCTMFKTIITFFQSFMCEMLDQHITARSFLRNHR